MRVRETEDDGSKEYPEKGLVGLSTCKQYPMEMVLC